MLKNVRAMKPYKEKSKNLWKCEVLWRDHRDKSCRKVFASVKKSEALRKAEEFRDELIMGSTQLAKSDDITFKSYADFWLKGEDNMDLKPTSFARKKQVLENHIYPHIGDFPLTSITPQDVKSIMSELEEQGLSGSTMKKVREIISQIYKNYRSTTGIDLDPTYNLKIPKTKVRDTSDICYFTPEECKKIEAEAMRKYGTGKSVYRLGAAFVLLLHTGLRASELLGLAWKNVNFEKNTISVVETSVSYQDEDGTYRMHLQKSAKTKNSIRHVPIDSAAMKALVNLRSVTGDEKYVMTTPKGTLVSYHTLNRTFHNILDAAKIDISDRSPIGVHALRHTFATELFRKGIDLKTISKTMGHTEISITADIYTHISQETLAEKLAAKLNQE